MTARDSIVFVPLTLAEAEALTLFLADREALWLRHAYDCGVGDPVRVAHLLSRAHASAVQRLAAEHQPLKSVA